MIKVIIERQIAEGMESTYEEEIRKTLGAVLGAPGYISGATFNDVDDPNRRVIITNWADLASWHQWYRSDRRREVHALLHMILQQEERVRVLEVHSV